MNQEERNAFEQFAELSATVMEQININMKIMFELLEKLEKIEIERKGMQVVKANSL